jgi:hypothetical protein
MSRTTRKGLAVLWIAVARLRFIAVFLLAALVFGYWEEIKNHVDRWTRPPVAPDAMGNAASSDIEFYCPMHPDVIRAELGQCPKCGMPLVKRKKGEAQKLPADVLARVTLTPRRLALAGVQTSAVEEQELVREIRSVGLLDYDETKLARISARISGRADELFVQFTGQAVKLGDPIYSLYSPEVFIALRQYLTARKRVNELPKEASTEAKADASVDYDATMQKLVLWGIGQNQLDQIDDEYDRTGRIPTNLTVASPIAGIVVRKDVTQGQYLQVGDSPYTVADLSRLWLQLKLYERDVPLVQVGDVVEVTVEAFPNQSFLGTVTLKAFQLDPETRTLDARVEVENASFRLRPGMLAAAVIHVPVAERTTPATAPSTAAASQPATRERPTNSAASAPAATVPAISLSGAYRASLTPYFAAHKLLSEDKAEGVAVLLQNAVHALKPASASESTAAAYGRLVAAAAKAPGQTLEPLRVTFRDVSAAMIELGKQIGLSTDGPVVNVFNCSMKKADWLQIGDQTINPYYGSRMYNCGSLTAPLPVMHVATSATALTPNATTGPATQQSSAANLSLIYRNALRPYLQAQKLLSEDKADGVARLVKEAAAKLERIEETEPGYAKLKAVAATMRDDQPIAELRKAFQDVSAAMIDLGKVIGTRESTPVVRVFRCPMKQANWLQEGTAVANPYYGAEMYSCGSATGTLPRRASALPTSRASLDRNAIRTLAVPRSAVIDTGRHKIVYVESSPGVFDMRAVKLGPAAVRPGRPGDIAEEFYPVVDGLSPGDRAVTVGTFLVDAENRLNPSRVAVESTPTRGGDATGSGSAAPSQPPQQQGNR